MQLSNNRMSLKLKLILKKWTRLLVITIIIIIEKNETKSKLNLKELNLSATCKNAI